MGNRENIQQELTELQSKLATEMPVNVYAVPNGYFEALPEQLLRTVRALDASNATEELAYLSPVLSSIDKTLPFNLPAAYFDELPGRILSFVKSEEQDAATELETLSPLLSGIKKEMPYSLPADYFDNLKIASQSKEEVQAPVISISRRKWFRYAAAAVLTGLIATMGLVFLNNGNGNSSDPASIVHSMMKKVSTDDIDEFVQLVEGAEPVIAKADIKTDKAVNEVKELTKDISDNEIDQFLDETQLALIDDNSDGSVMN